MEKIIHISEDTVIYEGEDTIYPGANTNLETLAIENILLYPAFNNSVTSYDAEVSNSTTNLNILAIPEDEDASVNIVMSDELVEGNNVVIINVVAADGVTKKTFTINVYRRNEEEEAAFEGEQEDNEAKLESLYSAERTSAEISNDFDISGEKNLIFFLIGVIIIIAVICIWLVKKRKKL